MGSRTATGRWGRAPSPARAGGEGGRPVLARALLLAAFLLPAPLPAPAAPPAPPEGAPPARSFEDRREAEREARSRFRRLEVASLVLIVAGAGAAAWWTLRKK